MDPKPRNARFVRLAETDRHAVRFSLDDVPCAGLEGDSLLVASLQNHAWLRASEFGDGKRAGFCLMGACQDCWMWLEDGTRVRACSTALAEGMSVFTRPPRDDWGLLGGFTRRVADMADEA